MASGHPLAKKYFLSYNAAGRPGIQMVTASLHRVFRGRTLPQIEEGEKQGDTSCCWPSSSTRSLLGPRNAIPSSWELSVTPRRRHRPCGGLGFRRHPRAGGVQHRRLYEVRLDRIALGVGEERFAVSFVMS